MTQKEKELLLKDLSARLPYGVICKVEFKDSEGWKTQNMSLKGVFINECYFTSDTGSICSKEFKPYLRSMSDMTEEELEEYKKVCELDTEILSNHPMDGTTPFPVLYNSQDYLNSIHVDYRGLIPMGLAIEVTKENNPYKDIEI